MRLQRLFNGCDCDENNTVLVNQKAEEVLCMGGGLCLMTKFKLLDLS
ncbi:hypothetical protein CLERM_003 [Coxiella-like endosymbiont]|nr:hypothetical protein CLERM_003 [Coxiella-like endosymbiont]